MGSAKSRQLARKGKSIAIVTPGIDLAKNRQQQSELLVHRARQGFVQQRIATINRIRRLLSEFGIALPLKGATVRREALHPLGDFPAGPTRSSATC